MFHRDNCKIDVSISDDQPKLLETLDTEGEEMSAYKFMEKMIDV
jgi:hypothetical protein